MFRNGVASAIGTGKAFPGTLACGANCGFRTVTVTPTGPNVSVTITAGANGGNLFEAAYLDSFNPASLNTNYIGDAGSSGSATFGMRVPAGHQVVLAVMNTTAGFTGTVSYAITDSGTFSAPTVPTVSSVMLAALAALLALSAVFAIRQAQA